MSTYYRESFEYPPIRMFLESASANSITNNGNVTFTLNQQIQIPNDVVGYVSLQELTIANTNYNINAYNNTLVFIDYAGNTQTYTITPGNYTVTTFLTALNVQLATGINNFLGITATYSDITNKFTIVSTRARTLSISSTSTLNACIGFPSGLIAGLSVLSGANTYSTYISTTARPGFIAIYLNTNDRLYFTDSAGNNLNIQIPPNALYTGTTLSTAMNVLFATANAGNNCNITVSFDTTTNLFTFSNTTTANIFTLLTLNSTILAPMGMTQANHPSIPYQGGCTLISSQIIDLSGNNSFYFTTDLITSNYNFVTKNGGAGSNILEKIQLTSDGTGIEFFKNINQFKTRFADKSISALNIVLLDENGLQWIPTSNWTCVLDFFFYEKYTELSHEKVPNLFQQMYKK
jgi:hypothetical protein